MKVIEKCENAAWKSAAKGVRTTEMLGAVCACALMITACGESGRDGQEVEDPWKDGVEEEWTAQGETVTFTLKGEFTIETSAITKATAQEAGVTDVWVLDYLNEGTAQEPQWALKQQVHQVQTDEGFGSPTMQLAYGQHKMVAVAAKGDGAELSVSTTEGHEGEGTLSWTKVRDTFVKNCPLEVVAGMTGNVSVTLDRAVGAVKLVIMDAVPENAKTIGMMMKRSQTLMLPSLEATEAVVSEVVSEVPASWAGKTERNMTIYTLCDESEDIVTDVEIVVKDGEGQVISVVTVEGVEVKRNCQTVMKGKVFDRNKALSVALNNTWSEESVMEF